MKGEVLVHVGVDGAVDAAIRGSSSIRSRLAFEVLVVHGGACCGGMIVGADMIGDDGVIVASCAEIFAQSSRFTRPTTPRWDVMRATWPNMSFHSPRVTGVMSEAEMGVLVGKRLRDEDVEAGDVVISGWDFGCGAGAGGCMHIFILLTIPTSPYRSS